MTQLLIWFSSPIAILAKAELLAKKLENELDEITLENAKYSNNYQRRNIDWKLSETAEAGFYDANFSSLKDRDNIFKLSFSVSFWQNLKQNSLV